MIQFEMGLSHVSNIQIIGSKLALLPIIGTRIYFKEVAPLSELKLKPRENDLPESYDKDLFKAKSNKVFELIYEYSSKGLKWVA